MIEQICDDWESSKAAVDAQMVPDDDWGSAGRIWEWAGRDAVCDVASDTGS